jgi:hypothetical protein
MTFFKLLVVLLLTTLATVGSSEASRLSSPVAPTCPSAGAPCDARVLRLAVSECQVKRDRCTLSCPRIHGEEEKCYQRCQRLRC